MSWGQCASVRPRIHKEPPRARKISHSPFSHAGGERPMLLSTSRHGNANFGIDVLIMQFEPLSIKLHEPVNHHSSKLVAEADTMLHIVYLLVAGMAIKAAEKQQQPHSLKSNIEERRGMRIPQKSYRSSFSLLKLPFVTINLTLRPTSSSPSSEPYPAYSVPNPPPSPPPPPY